MKIYATIGCMYRPSNDSMKLHDQCSSYAGEKKKIKVHIGRFTIQLKFILNILTLFFLHCIPKQVQIQDKGKQVIIAL